MHIVGTVSRTGDPELVKQNIVQVTPLIQGQNSYRILRSNLYGEHRRVKVVTPYQKSAGTDLDPRKPWINPAVLNEFNNYLRAFDYNKPLESERLIIDIVMTSGYYLD